MLNAKAKDLQKSKSKGLGHRAKDFVMKAKATALCS